MSCPSYPLVLCFALRLRMICAQCVFCVLFFVYKWRRIMNNNHSANQSEPFQVRIPLSLCCHFSQRRIWHSFFMFFVSPSGISQFCWLLPLSVSSNTSATLRPRVLFKQEVRPAGSREPDPLPPARFSHSSRPGKEEPHMEAARRALRSFPHLLEGFT